MTRAVLAGASPPELVNEAVHALLAEGTADRVGVWIEAKDQAAADPGVAFRGVVAGSDGAATPAEWSRLSPAALPREVLMGLQSVEQDLLGSSNRPVIGAIVEMHRALWVPVAAQGQLRGAILVGTRKRHPALPKTLAETLAAELALALEVDDERRWSRERQQDFACVRTALASVAGAEPPETLLRKLVEDCTAVGETGSGPDAVFAAVGEWMEPPAAEPQAVLSEKQTQDLAAFDKTPFRWSSGDAVWTRALESEPLAGVWRQALDSHRVVGSEPGGAWSHREVARVVAFPLRSGPHNLGVLVAGIRRGSASLHVLERLELRAGLAASTLLRRKQSEEAIQSEACQKALKATVLAARVPEGQPASPQFQRDRTELLNVIEWLEEGVVLFGADNEIRAMNSRFGQIVGLAPQEGAELKTLDDLLDRLAEKAADPASFAERWRQLTQTTDGATREELQFARPVPRLLERAARPILDDRGVLLGRVEIYRDLTAQRLFHSKLLQTEKMAALGQMVTGIAHELSNPLTSILGYAQRLLARSDATTLGNEARQIYEEAERASVILRQLLLTARDSRPERRRVSLNQVVSRAVELQRFSLAADKLRLELDLDPLLPAVQGDSGQLQQVLMNLMGNARQAMEEQGKGGTIQVRTRRVAEKRVLLEVRDDGPGIPAAIQARIFDPFFTTKPAGVGTGLGLAIVLGIVREHGGHVRVTSPPAGGTTFSVELPVAATLEMSGPRAVNRRADDSKEPSAPLTPSRADALLSPWAGTRVLVVEDEPTVARLIGDVLEDEGLRADVLFDGREALRRVAQESYDLVICDMKMPDLDGEHFYQTLALENNPARGRFLFVTGDVLAARTRDFLERNDLPHLAKPFRVEELTEKIRSVLVDLTPRVAADASDERKKAARQ